MFRSISFFRIKVLVAIISCTSFYCLNAQEYEEFLDGGILYVKAKPDQGFNYDYYIFLPNDVINNDVPILVETNNTGFPTDDIFVHRHSAMGVAIRYSSGCFVASSLKVPFLVPVFPRPVSQPNTYTHALDRETLQIKDGEMERLDLQLIDIIEDAKEVLATRDIYTKDKVLFNGFSASGTFLNRFLFLHPEKILAAAAGGVNAFLMLPIDSIGDYPLNYPLGTNDLNHFVSSNYNNDLPKKVPQFYYMGVKDGNDAVSYNDAYNEQEREIIYAAIGKAMFPDRWEKCQKIYKNSDFNVRFETFDHIGHGTDLKVLNAVVDFFREYLD